MITVGVLVLAAAAGCSDSEPEAATATAADVRAWLSVRSATDEIGCPFLSEEVALPSVPTEDLTWSGSSGSHQTCQIRSNGSNRMAWRLWDDARDTPNPPEGLRKLQAEDFGEGLHLEVLVRPDYEAGGPGEDMIDDVVANLARHPSEVESASVGTLLTPDGREAAAPGPDGLAAEDFDEFSELLRSRIVERVPGLSQGAGPSIHWEQADDELQVLVNGQDPDEDGDLAASSAPAICEVVAGVVRERDYADEVAAIEIMAGFGAETAATCTP